MPLAEYVEDILRAVTGLHQRLYGQEARATLDRMEPPEDRIQQIVVFRLLLQVHQLLAELLDYLGGLDQKVLEDFIVCIETHGSKPQT